MTMPCSAISSRVRLGRRLFVSLALAGAASLARAQIPAFPGAEGYGAYAAGGRGGDVYYVTNLNTSGAGSFADGIANAPAAGRTIVFAVSGYIPVPSSNLRIAKNKITVAGQTAPGDGIGFRNGTFRVSADDIVIRHVRFRHGKGGSGGDCVDLDSASDRSILDHVTMQFSTDENMSSFNSPPDNVTLQYSLNAWGLETHSCGGLWDQNHATALYTLWAHNHTRNPKARPVGLLEWVNNVTFDWDIGFILGDSETPIDWKANVIGNYFVCPPGNTRSVALEKARLDRNGNPNFTLHVADNLFDKNGNELLDGSDYGYGIASGAYTQSVARLPAAGSSPVIPVSPRLAYKKIVSSAGPLRLDAASGVPLRDEVDTLLIDNLVQLRRNHIQRESELAVTNSGFGALNSTAAPLDTDRDGMPDAYEISLGWSVSAQDHNTALPSSGGVVAGATYFPSGTPAGYTRLEEYLHFLASPHVTVARNTAETPASVVIDLSRYTLGFNSLSPAFTLAKVVGGSAVQSGAGGRIVTFTPTLNTAGRARFEFTVTDSQGDAWTQSFLLLVSSAGAPRDLVWQGDGISNTWNTSASNWTRNAIATTFASGDNVLFDDRGSASPPIAVPSSLAAGTLTVDAAKNYALSGAGALSGGGSLTKRGSGSFTLGTAGANSFGAIVHEAGELVLAKSTAAGGAKIQLQGGTLTLSPDVVGSSVSSPLEFSAPTVINVATQHNSTGNWTGSGDVTIHTSALWTITGTWSGYSGRITLGSAGTPRVRLNSTSNTNFGSAALAIDLGAGAGQLMNRNGGSTAYALGTLTGGPNTQLQGTQTPAADNSNSSTYSIGARNENATFQGSIRNGGSTGAVLTHVTKVGTGAWTLAGSSTHTGTTTVSAGTLRLNGTFAASPLVVSTGAVLAGAGSTAGPVTVNAGGRLAPGAADGAAGVFTASGGLTANSGATLVFDLGPAPAAASDRITVSGGTAALSGTVTFQLNFLDLENGLAPGTYSLIDGAATLSASGLALTPSVPAPAGTTRQTFSLVRPASGSNPAYVNLVVSGSAAPLVWSGPDGGNWDLNTTSGNFTGGSPAAFYNLDRVTFDDSSAGGTVNLVGTLQPTLLTVNNTAKNFTLGGSGLLGGAMKLVKSGSGTLTLAAASPHTFTGGVELNGGTLALAGTSTPLGTGPVLVNGGVLQLPNSSTFVSNSFVFSGSSAIVSPYTGNCTLANSVANTFSSNGPATVDLSGIAGILSINGDMSGFSGTLSFGAGAGMLRLNSNSSGASDVNRGSAGAHFDLGGGTATAGARLVNRNGGLTIELGALSGGPLALLSGRQSGSGDTSTTYRVGALGTDALFQGSIQHGGDLAGVQIVKVGSGRWTLSGASDYTGSLSVEAGRLVLSGTLACSGKAEIGAAGSLQLSGGTLRAESIDLAAGALLTGLGTLDGDLNNRGILTASGPGALTVTGDVVNDGVLRLTSGARLDATGAFVNNGVLDLLTARGSLPANLVNNGTVIDASAASLSSWSREGTAFTLRIVSYSGHTYTLQTAGDLAAGWTGLESKPGADGVELVFTHDAGPAASRFYRILVSP